VKDGDKRLELLEITLGRTLRAGLISSISVILFGIVLAIVNHPELREAGSLHKFIAPGGYALTGFHGIVDGLKEFKAMAWISLGIFMLILTPTVRVGISFFIFWYQGDKKFMVITAIVFTLLMVSLVLGSTVL